MSRVGKSTPVYLDETIKYYGIYNSEGSSLTYQVVIDCSHPQLRITADDPAKSEMFELKNVIIHDAYFKADKVLPTGGFEKLEGVFIDKNDNGRSTFGLGLKFSRPFEVTEGLSTDKIFLKKMEQ
jgi:hypothetical protein